MRQHAASIIVIVIFFLVAARLVFLPKNTLGAFACGHHTSVCFSSTSLYGHHQRQIDTAAAAAVTMTTTTRSHRVHSVFFPFSRRTYHAQENICMCHLDQRTAAAAAAVNQALRLIPTKRAIISINFSSLLAHSHGGVFSCCVVCSTRKRNAIIIIINEIWHNMHACRICAKINEACFVMDKKKWRPRRDSRNNFFLLLCARLATKLLENIYIV